jgi:hypothetical protein
MVRSPFISLKKRVAHLYPQALGSLFVAFYDSQGYGGGIRPRLHTGFSSQSSESQSYLTTGGPTENRVFTGIYLRSPAMGCLPRICSPSNGDVTLFFSARTCLPSRCPGIGNIRGLNLAAVKSTTVQVSDCRF